MTFLKRIASEFYKRKDLSELCFVFPNRRAGLFFKKYLGELVEKPIFSPTITTIKDLFINASGLREADNLDMLFRLYRLYKEISDSAESFDDFLFWGEVILTDFNDVDKFDADAKKLFANIKELKEIESDYSFLSPVQLEAVKSFWAGFLPEGNSEKKNRFTALWSVLYPLYERFVEELLEEGCGYEGMIYRHVAHTTESIDKIAEYKRVIFIGLNALNRCEKRLLSELKKRGVADFYWDYYGNMVTDPDNSASHFMAENVALFPSEIEIEQDEFSLPEIEVIGVASSVMQTKIASSILEEIGGDINSAVILPDERLLMPLLYSIPENFSSINVSMGYQLRNSPIYSLVESVIELIHDKDGYYYKRVLPILRHNYIKLICRQEADTLIEQITERNMIYISPAQLSVNPLLSAIFFKRKESPSLSGEPGVDSVEKLRDVCEKLLKVIDLLVCSGGIGGMDKEFAYHIYVTVKRIEGILIPMSKESFSGLLMQILSSVSIPFKGEPLSGLQIMGVLETRVLDFENIIYCSMNEGVFPQNPYGNSFIPYNLRRGFSLPVKEYNDAISSYIFYRSIYRAKKVYLLHDTRSEGIISGESSRFILQLKYHYRLPIKESTVSFKAGHSERRSIAIEKSADIIERMRSLFLKGGTGALSATSIDTYITCPLKFYLRYVKRVEEEAEVKEEIEADDFGKIFHKAMQLLYAPYIGNIVTKEIISKMLRSEEAIESAIDAGLAEYKNISEAEGYNLLIKRIIIRYVEQTLKHDTGLTPFDYIGSEIKISTTFALESGDEINLKGFVDRHDRCNGVERIVDYKSGSGSVKFKTIEELFDKKSNSRNSVVFQLLFYAYMMKCKDGTAIVPYFLKNIFNDADESITVEKEILETFSAMLSATLSELFDNKVPFEGREEDKKCEYCPYNQLCY